MPEWLETWYQPTLGALHVLGVAWFGTTLFTDTAKLRVVGLSWMLATGVLLMAANPSHVLASNSFRIKLALLAALISVRHPRWVVVSIWIAVIFASRGIAYF
jgi:hypothetical protein